MKKNKTEQPTTTQKSVGKSKASKQAVVNQRRGLRNRKKPTAMEVAKEVNKQKKKDTVMKKKSEKQKKQVNSRKNLSKAQLKIIRETESKATSLTRIINEAVNKASAGKSNRNVAPDRPPSKKAVNAAVAALQLAGYKPPDGMKMVIKLEHSNADSRGNESAQQRQQQTSGKNQQGNRGGNGRNDGYRQARKGGGNRGNGRR